MHYRTNNASLLRSILLIAMGSGLVAGCGQGNGEIAAPEAGIATDQPVAVPPPQGPLRLPVSLNDVMVALVNHAADPIWVAAWRNPETDQDWRNLERMAYQLEVAGAILVIPGTGPRDVAWVNEPDWRAWSANLRQVGERAVAAVAARDLSAISTVGNELVEVCEGCHRAFKPAQPTGGKFGELSPTADNFEAQ